MKNHALRVTVPCLASLMLALVISFLVMQPVRAQDPLKVAPNMYKLVFENERVRVMEVSFKPGERIAEHSHPDHFAYVLSPGKLKITAGEKVTEADLTVGQLLWIPAETHWAVNAGTTDVRVLVTELKEPAMPAKPAAVGK